MLEDPGWGAYGDQGEELSDGDRRGLAAVAVSVTVLFLAAAAFIGLSGGGLAGALCIAGMALLAGGFIVCGVLVEDTSWRALARWVLASEWRTWALVAPCLVAALIDVLVRQGWGSAVLSPPVIAGYHLLVWRLRKRLGVKADDSE
ncbi:MAG: hypothetical protein HOV96_21255 [Nonomuraea sp.]|nr:hypothetical protein [Nonomuraea sp.]NUP62915.1 hypothetical protein [Nonomuraea sp.]NUP80070.1 hypothetical protein [Nonomuraea sp.]